MKHPMKLNASLADLGFSDAKGLWFLNRQEERFGFIEDARNRRLARQSFLTDIKEKAEVVDGKLVVALCSWSRDCDCCESNSRAFVGATVAEVESAIEHDLKWADGPVNHWLQRPSDAFERNFRDRALEAFEDGHSHAIY